MPGIPLLAEEGWPRPKNSPVPKKARTGWSVRRNLQAPTSRRTDHYYGFALSRSRFAPVCGAFGGFATFSCRGRDGDYWPPPAQIRTYRFPIFGSCLGSSAKARRRIRMTDDSRRNPAIDVALHAVPPDGTPLTPATQPFLP